MDKPAKKGHLWIPESAKSYKLSEDEKNIIGKAREAKPGMEDLIRTQGLGWKPVEGSKRGMEQLVTPKGFGFVVEVKGNWHWQVELAKGPRSEGTRKTKEDAKIAVSDMLNE